MRKPNDKPITDKRPSSVKKHLSWLSPAQRVENMLMMLWLSYKRRRKPTEAGNK